MKFNALLYAFFCTNALGHGWTYELDILTKPVPNRVHVLAIDPKQCHISLKHATEHREPLSSIVRQSGAHAGINAGFFRRGGQRNGNSIGLLKIGPVIFADPGLQRGILMWRTGEDACIGTLKTQWLLTIGDKHFTIDKVNQPCLNGEIGIFNRYYGRLIDAPLDNINVRAPDGAISEMGSTRWTPNHGGYTISFSKQRISPDILKKLAKGTPVTIKAMAYLDEKYQDLFSENLYFCVNGAGTLITNGHIHTEQEITNEFSTGREVVELADEVSANFKDPQQAHWLIYNRHPRTAVGLTKDNTWICVVVEGRRKGISEGMTLAELAQYLHARGCVNAINLGGGGDSTMVFENVVKNIPSGSSSNAHIKTEERPISDAIIIEENVFL